MLSKAPKQLNIILCEDIRQEAGNKVSLIGVYTDGIIFQIGDVNPAPPLQIAQIAVYATFEQLEKSCELKIKLIDPSGETIFETPKADVIPAGKGITMVAFKMLGLTFKAQGTHKVEFQFDNKKVSFKFLVSTEKTQ
jgi:hypothetical protein